MKVLKISKLLTVIFGIMLLSFQLFNLPAQERSVKWMYLWNGLRAHQSEAEMPKGKAPAQHTVRKAKVNQPTRMVPVKAGEWIISDGWELSEATPLTEAGISLFDPDLNTDTWYNATVPGTVLTTLVEQGIYPDPYFGLNNLAITDTLCRMDWWYRTTFELPAEATPGKQIRLLFNGINYRAEVYFNGKKLGNINGAFVRGEFNVTQLVKTSGKNILAVHILPPYNPGIPHEQSMVAGQGLNGGQLCLDGPTFIAAEGWDWVPGIRDRNIGIWQDVRMLIGGAVQIMDPQVITNISANHTQAQVTIHAQLKNTTSQAIKGSLTAKTGDSNDIEVHLPYSLNPNESKEVVFAPVTIKDPKLWWPNGYGSQSLYPLELIANNGSELSDTKKLRFGIREMSYELMVHTQKGNMRVEYTPTKDLRNEPVFDYIHREHYDKEIQLPTLYNEADLSVLKELPSDDPVGPYLVIKVNGVRIFCRGGNWGMDDAMKRSTRNRLEPYFKLHQDMNFNIIRNWTGENTEELFYELCDEYGMLVWNDFWITTENSNVDPNDHELFMLNATDAVRRFRNHPSIAIWCPRNEGFSPDGLEAPIAAMIAREDPTRHYHGQSRYLNMRGSGPWGYFKDASQYYTSNAQGFNTEMGCHAIPTANTLRKFIAPEDLWPINDVWAYHDLHHTSQAFGDFMDAVGRYGTAAGYEDFCKKSQMVTYDAWRNMLEAWNSRMWNNTTGLILWMSHPAWPSMIWQTYTYDYETPGSYFGSKKACEPVHIQMNLPDNKVVIVNTTRNNYQNVNASLRYFNLQGKELFKKQLKINAPANQTTACFIPEQPNNLPEIYLARLELKSSKGETLSVNDYWKSNNHTSYLELNKLGAPEFKTNVTRTKNSAYLHLSIANKSNVPAIAVKLNARDKTTGEYILPAYFSDGYFNLLPGEERKIDLTLPSGSLNFDIVAEGYNFTTQIINNLK